jgi:glutamine---fructose-6-phosphate transaminase (isomerizing)
MALLPPPDRVEHPFYTYDMIKGIPHGFTATLSKMEELKISERPESLVATGNGTAFYSAWMGVQTLDDDELSARAIQAMELANYSHVGKGSLVVGVSHSGITKSTVDALKSARDRGARTIGLTHFPGRPIGEVADTCVVIGDGPDKSRCHTKTYTDSAAAVAVVALRVAELSGIDTGDKRASLQSLKGSLSQAVSDSESASKKFVEECNDFQKVVLAGAGPNLVTVREAALKLKESCFLPAEGIELEELGHGAWVAIDRSTLLIAVAPGGPSAKRAEDVIKAARLVGAKTLSVSDLPLGAEYEIKIEAGQERFSPFLTVIPLYYLAYFLSVRKGYNPDYIRYLTPEYWAARQIIFPPGTH